jgi:pyridinium-3,5-bisthiocarboxylic acid mononucleotide nickel chelatase
MRVISGDVLVVRPNSGLSGDIFVAGLARMADLDGPGLSALIRDLALPVPPDGVCLRHHSVNEVAGWLCAVSLPHEHVHRTLGDILGIIEASAMTATAKRLASRTFTLLAEAEGRVHRMPPLEVTFHEVGALDSILDICLAAVLFDRISPAAFICGPLPLCDGVVRCSHGLVPSPAPAVLELLEGVPVRGIATDGETVTPTAIALLKGLGATFGPWPDVTISRRALVYGTKVFSNVPNGAIFVLGRPSTGMR